MNQHLSSSLWTAAAFRAPLRVLLTLNLVLPGLALAADVMTITGDRIGIVTTTPTAPMDVNIGSATPGTGNSVLRLERVGPVGFQLKDTNDANFWQFSAATGASEFRISRSGTGVTELRLTNAGNLIIDGDITSNGTTFVPDYVFADDYPLMPLSELAAFVSAEGHLPKVPPAEEIQQSGLNMTDMQMRLLEKIEELTLYTLDQQETIEALTLAARRQQELIDQMRSQLGAYASQ